jgi:soluble lytic murein transglycosylase-like protein
MARKSTVHVSKAQPGERDGRGRGSAVRLCTVVLAVAALLLAASNAPAFTSGHVREPTKTAIARLKQYEPYIQYFTSLTYGPEATSVSPDYLRALILTESAADPWAVSHKGARGLTQIMPSTGRIAAAEIAASGIDYRGVDESRLVRLDPDRLFDPAVNLLIACYLSAKYQSDFGGDLELVAAAWNAGPNRVTQYGLQPPPYRETHQMLRTLAGYLNYFGGRALAHDGGWIDFRSPRWDTADWNAAGWADAHIDDLFE